MSEPISFMGKKARIQNLFAGISGIKRILIFFITLITIIFILDFYFPVEELIYVIPSLFAAIIWAISFLILNESSKQMDSVCITKYSLNFLQCTAISIKAAFFTGIIPFLSLIILNFTIFNPQISGLFSTLPPEFILYFIGFGILTGVFTYIFGTGFYYRAHLLGKTEDVEFHAGAFKFSIAVCVLGIWTIFLWPSDEFSFFYLIQDQIAIISAVLILLIFFTTIYTLYTKRLGKIGLFLTLAGLSWIAGEIFVIFMLKMLKTATSDLLL
ncbi:MAG: hypothetical protein EU536_04825, partial [Promethearchaeota archaeon]